MSAGPTAASQGAEALLLAEIGACQGCGACLLTCPEHAIRPDGRRLEVRAGLCTGCGQCQEVCPVDAIELRVRT